MELKSYTACYGILGLQNFLLPSCPAGQKIAVMAVYMLAKYKSTGCPQIQTSPGDDPACCQYDVTDCSYLYDSGSFRAYYQTCNGKPFCQIQVSWIAIPSHCNRSVYIERTHYMKMDYYCISGTYFSENKISQNLKCKFMKYLLSWKSETHKKPLKLEYKKWRKNVRNGCIHSFCYLADGRTFSHLDF